MQFTKEEEVAEEEEEEAEEDALTELPLAVICVNFP